MSGDCGPFVPSAVANGPTGGGAAIRSIAGGTTLATGPLVSFVNSNNISFGISGNTITASVIPEAGIALAVPGSTLVTGTVVLSNSNGVSFGINGSTVTARVFSVTGTNGEVVQVIGSGVPMIISNVNTNVHITAGGLGDVIIEAGPGAVRLRGDLNEIAAQSNRTVAFYGVGGATRQTVTGTNATAFNNLMVALNSLGIISNGATMSAFATGNFGAIAAGTQTATSGTIVFADSNGVSFGMSGSTQVTASIRPNPAISAAGASADVGTIVFSNSNGVSFGMAGSTVTASANVGQSGLGWTKSLGPVSTFFAGIATNSRTMMRVSFASSMTLTRALFLLSATNNQSIVASLAIYTFSVSTANTVSSNATTLNYSSVGPALDLTLGSWAVTPGEYLLGFAVSSNNNPTWFGSQSAPIQSGGITAAWFRDGWYTRAFASSVHLTHVSQHVSNIASVSNFGNPYIELMAG